MVDEKWPNVTSLNVRVRKVGVILMILSLLHLIGCSAIDKDTASQITTALQEKYGEEFKCDSIGNRFGTATNDTVTGYCYPSSNPSVLFEVIMDKDGEIVGESYISSFVSDILENAIVQEFQNENVIVHVSASAYRYDEMKEFTSKSNLTINNFIKENPRSGFSADIIVDESSNIEDLAYSISDVYLRLSEKYPQLSLGAQIKIISNLDFVKCSEEMDNNPTVSKTLFEKYDVKGEVIVGIKNGKPTKEINEIQNEIKSGG